MKKKPEEKTYTSRKAKTTALKKQQRRLIILCSLLGLIIVVLGATVGIGARINKLAKDMNKDNLPTAEKVSNLEKEPFSILFIGLGTNGDDGEAPLADSINLITVNPVTNYAEIIAIPRDSYLPFGEACNWGIGSYDKITHSTGESPECLQTTLENVFDIKINYFVSVNFVGFIKIVDALGGVEMDVPDLRAGFEAYPGDPDDGLYLPPELKNGLQWCESDSYRNPYAVCFDKFEKQKVNGEQALALARTRHYDGDFGRSIRQTELIKAIVEKSTSMTGILSVNQLLDAAGETIETNIPANNFLDFATLGTKMLSNKNANSPNAFQMRTTQLAGQTATFEGQRITGTNISYSVVPVASVEDIRIKIKQVMGDGDVVISPGNFDFTVEADQPPTNFTYDETLDKFGLENVPTY